MFSLSLRRLAGVFGPAGSGRPARRGLRLRLELLEIVLPKYRVWVVVASLVVCFATWWVIERSKLGAYLRALVMISSKAACTASALASPTRTPPASVLWGMSAESILSTTG